MSYVVPGLQSRPAVDISWHDAAVCKSADPKLFFAVSEGEPDDPGNQVNRGQITKERYEDAKSYCDRCPVVRQCLNYALGKDGNNPEREGVWGNMTPDERQEYVRKQRRRATADKMKKLRKAA